MMTGALGIMVLVLFSCKYRSVYSAVVTYFSVLPDYKGEEVQSITLTSLPDVLFSGRSQTMLEGSVVRLYCLVGPILPNLTVTWNKDNKPLVQDVPHILLRTTNIGITSISTLSVNGFEISDSGAYQCIAQEENILTSGKISRLIGISLPIKI